MYIYKITNKVNGMIYIGQSKKSFNESKSYMGSGKKIVGEIYIYGKENFVKDLIEECNTIEELDLREAYWIQYYDSANPEIGYNLRYGGNSSLYNKEFKDTMKKSMSGEKNPFYGRTHNTESKQKMSTAKIGSNNPNFGKMISDENRDKISKKLTGIKRNDLTKSLMSDSAKNRFYEETKCPHCDKIGKQNMKRYHFDNCKHNGKNK
jgi:group I intron endonuclease